MSNEKNFEDPFQDPFENQMDQDPFIEDHFGGASQGSQSRHGNETLPDSTAVLVLGILSILGTICYGVLGLILGILAVAMSSKPTRLYRANPGRYSHSSYSNMKAGKICGIIGLCISVVILICIVAFVFVMVESEFRY